MVALYREPPSARAVITEQDIAMLQAEIATLRARIAELEARQVPEGWRPIETAPKDGTQIILTNGTDVAQGWWEHQEPYVREIRDTEGYYVDQIEHDGFDDWLDCLGGMLPEPTHWMPLPAAPSPADTREEKLMMSFTKG